MNASDEKAHEGTLEALREIVLKLYTLADRGASVDVAVDVLRAALSAPPLGGQTRIEGWVHRDYTSKPNRDYTEFLHEVEDAGPGWWTRATLILHERTPESTSTESSE